MSSGDAALQGMIDKLAVLGRVEDLAKSSAPLVVAAVKSTAAAGTSTDGVPWLPRKDGSPALQNAAAAVEGDADGATIHLRLVGTSTGSQRAQAIQNHTRPILPLPGRLGKPVTSALTAAAQRYFARSLGK